jgi:hypothetical protein
MSPFYDPDDLEFEEEEDFVDDELAGPTCVGCGCTEGNACEGGCVWATPTLCSRCV